MQPAIPTPEPSSAAPLRAPGEFARGRMSAISLSQSQQALLLCAAVTAAACIQPLGMVAHTFGDADDAARLVEVRALLHGRQWFDLVEPRFAPPMGLDVHWSRLIDAPIAI